MNDSTKSILMRGTVAHSRLAEPSSSLVHHAFKYDVWMALLDLDEIDSATAFPKGSRVVADITDHWALACWRRHDHFGDPEVPLSQCAKRVFRENLPHLNIASIRLLTNLASFGAYNFNPVSIYYGYELDCITGKERLAAALLEVR